MKTSTNGQDIKIPNITELMDDGEPVCVTFIDSDTGNQISENTQFLFCEMIQRARYGETFNVEKDRCPVGNYVLDINDKPPFEYYLKSGRYKDRDAAYNASVSLPRIKKTYKYIRIEPLSRNKKQFDVLILFLKPEAAMRIIQAFSYQEGKQVNINTLGAASVCGDCTAVPISDGIGVSFGCKGSRKHGDYRNTEVPLGIGFEMTERIEKGLEKTPKTRD
jgi:uncharacterized protein (DUF169 family)